MDSDHYLVIARLRARILNINKQGRQDKEILYIQITRGERDKYVCEKIRGESETTPL